MGHRTTTIQKHHFLSHWPSHCLSPCYYLASPLCCLWNKVLPTLPVLVLLPYQSELIRSFTLLGVSKSPQKLCRFLDKPKDGVVNEHVTPNQGIQPGNKLGLKAPYALLTKPCVIVQGCIYPKERTIFFFFFAVIHSMVLNPWAHSQFYFGEFPFHLSLHFPSSLPFCVSLSLQVRSIPGCPLTS